MAFERGIIGRLIVISGPSGVGKGEICKRVAAHDDKISISVSATTRKPRSGETDGVSYFFVSRERFEEMIAQDELLEYMDVFGTNYYGTPLGYVNDMLSSGRDVILEIDVNGAMNVKRKMPDAITLFIAPPSYKELRRRLVGRGTETAEQIEKRFGKAAEEISHIGAYDYVVVNDVLDEAVADVETIIRADRLRVKRLVNPDDMIKEEEI